MSRDAVKDLSASHESEQLLSDHICADTLSKHVNVPIAEQRSTDEVVVSMSRPMSQDKFTELNRNAQVLEPLNNPTTPIITPASIIVNDTEENDDPPPYSAIVPPNHVGWPYNLFSSGNSYYTDATSCRVEIPLAPFQTSLTPYFHPEGTNGHHHPSIPMPATPYQFFKFDCRRNSSTRRETSFSSDGVAEKINDRKSRRYGVILVAAAVIISLMALSLMVRFVMERSWWRR